MSRRPLLVAPVSGFPAWRLGLLLEEIDLDGVIARHERQGVDAQAIAEFRQTCAAIKAAGAQWQAWRASVDVTTEATPTEAEARSSQEITPGEASVLLSVSPARVRQILRAGVIDGRKVGRAWLTTRGEIEAYRHRKAAS